MPKFKNNEGFNAVTVNDSKSRSGEQKSFMIRKHSSSKSRRHVDNATEAGAVPFRPRIKNPKAVNLQSENGNGL